mmetsp:Transcript_36177/g.81321  ORF Transcript_36177/g.81321 Transcript_36177/m.81321 type:complete len:594 (-) Transcript_36177:370-2151(-)
MEQDGLWKAYDLQLLRGGLPRVALLALELPPLMLEEPVQAPPDGPVDAVRVLPHVDGQVPVHLLLRAGVPARVAPEADADLEAEELVGGQEGRGRLRDGGARRVPGLGRRRRGRTLRRRLGVPIPVGGLLPLLPCRGAVGALAGAVLLLAFLPIGANDVVDLIAAVAVGLAADPLALHLAALPRHCLELVVEEVDEVREELVRVPLQVPGELVRDHVHLALEGHGVGRPRPVAVAPRGTLVDERGVLRPDDVERHGYLEEGAGQGEFLVWHGEVLVFVGLVQPGEEGGHAEQGLNAGAEVARVAQVLHARRVRGRPRAQRAGAVPRRHTPVGGGGRGVPDQLRVPAPARRRRRAGGTAAARPAVAIIRIHRRRGMAAPAQGRVGGGLATVTAMTVTAETAAPAVESPRRFEMERRPVGAVVVVLAPSTPSLDLVEVGLVLPSLLASVLVIRGPDGAAPEGRPAQRAPAAPVRPGPEPVSVPAVREPRVGHLEAVQPSPARPPAPPVALVVRPHPLVARALGLVLVVLVGPPLPGPVEVLADPQWLVFVLPPSRVARDAVQRLVQRLVLAGQVVDVVAVASVVLVGPGPSAKEP